jgi:predicted  nucleic acid-binding Zn-ribbon protein
VFRKDMFVKNNKAAFQHVIYYMFTILDPDLTKEKITVWPLYDVKLEHIFRKQVVEMMEAINSKYAHANVPSIMASHLISPGGFSFSKFMLKLSLLVMYEHLKRNDTVEPEILAPIRPHTSPVVTNAIISNMKVKTLNVEAKTQEMWTKFVKGFQRATAEANSLTDEQTQIEKDLSELNKRLKESRRDFIKTNQENNERLSILKEKMVHLESIKNLCVRSKDLLIYLDSDQLELKFNKTELTTSDSTFHLHSCDEKVNLHHFFEKLTVLLENENFEMPMFASDQLNDRIKVVTELSENFSEMDQKLSSHRNKLTELIESCPTEMAELSRTRMNKKQVLVIAVPIDS